MRRVSPARASLPGRRGRARRSRREHHEGRSFLLPLLRRGGPRTAGSGRRRMALPQLHEDVPATLCRNRSHPLSPVVAPGLAHISLEDPEHMRTLAEQAAEDLADAPAEEVIRWAVDTFGDRICVTSSMTDAVIIHLASAVHPGIDVVFLDTGYHFAETIGTRDAVEAVYPIHRST